MLIAEQIEYLKKYNKKHDFISLVEKYNLLKYDEIDQNISSHIVLWYSSMKEEGVLFYINAIKEVNNNYPNYIKDLTNYVKKEYSKMKKEYLSIDVKKNISKTKINKIFNKEENAFDFNSISKIIRDEYNINYYNIFDSIQRTYTLNKQFLQDKYNFTEEEIEKSANKKPIEGDILTKLLMIGGNYLEESIEYYSFWDFMLDNYDICNKEIIYLKKQETNEYFSKIQDIIIYICSLNSNYKKESLRLYISW